MAAQRQAGLQKLLAALLAAGSTTLASAAPGSYEEMAAAARADCARAAAAYPAKDRPSPPERSKLAKCDADALYYGIGVPRDFEAARRCADAALNAAWAKLRATPDPEYSTVKLAGIRMSQRAWLRYRDAWLAFAQQRYPAVPATAWQTMLTKERTTRLLGLVEDRAPLK